MASLPLKTDAEHLLEDVRAVQSKCELCRVLHNVGSYRCIMDVPYRNYGTTVKFQVPGGYPSIAPDIVVVSTDLSMQQRMDLEGLLRDLCRHAADCSDGLGSRLLPKLVDSAAAWLEASCVDHSGTGRNSSAEGRPSGHTGHGGNANRWSNTVCDGLSELDESDGTARQKSSTKSRAARKAAKQQELAARNGDGTSSGKKPPMRTAEDVIKRITWDKSLSASRFVIGYVDRFVGIIEKPFTDFSWEHLASVDQSTLAIPQHRIEYFKYDGKKVWEKSTRLDDVFGSTGSRTTITDVVASSVAGELGVANGGNEKAAANLDDIVGEIGGSHFSLLEEGTGEKDDDYEKDDSSDVVRWVDAVPRQKPRPSGIGAASAKPKPNYFVCLRITAPAIVAKVAAVQADLIRRRPELAPHVLPPSRLHITLAVLLLPTTKSPAAAAAAGRSVGDDEAEQVALKALARTARDWSRGPIALSVSGLRQFARRVLYGRVLPSADLDDMVTAVRRSLLGSGVTVCDEEFVPHMTLVKLPVSAARGSRLCVDVADVAAGSAGDDMPFGDDSVGSLHLCSFLKDHLDTAAFYDSAAADLPLPQRAPR